jgi:hypothetical protein
MSAASPVLGNATVRRSNPGTVSDDATVSNRAARHGELLVMDASRRQMMSNSGFYFQACTATPGTGIIQHASVTAYDATKPCLLIANTATATEGTRIVLDKLRKLTSVAGAAATSFRYEWRTDVVSRYTSGGTALVARKTSTGATGTGKALIYTGAITAPAASSGERIFSNGVLRQGLGAAGDEFNFVFGGDPQFCLTPLTTVIAKHVIDVAPIVLEPGSVALLYEYGASQTTAVTSEVELSYWED